MDTLSRRKIMLRLLAATSLAGLYDLPAAAQTTAPDDSRAAADAAKTDAQPAQADDIIVTGARVEEVSRGAGYRASTSSAITRAPVSILDTPNSISVITQDLIRDRGATSTNQLTETIAGVAQSATGASGAYDGIIIRGLGGVSTLRENNLAIGTNYPADPAIIERIEVIKGPSSISGGRVSPGGYLNRELKFASGDDHFIVEGGVDNEVKARGDIDIDRRVSDNFYARLVAAGSVGNEFINHIDGYTLSLLPSVQLTPGAKTKIKLSVNLHYTNTDTFDSVPVLPDGSIPRGVSARTSINVRGNDRIVKHVGTNAEVVHNFLDDLQLTARLGTASGTARSKSVYNYDYLDSDYNSSLYAGLRKRTLRGYAGDVYLTKSFGAGDTKSSIVAGVDHVGETTKYELTYQYLGQINLSDFDTRIDYPGGLELSNDTPNGTYVYRRSHIDQTGFYGQAVVRPVAGLTLIGGLRYDILVSRNATQEGGISASLRERDTALTKRVGGSYEFGKAFVPYVSYAESFVPNTGAFTQDNSALPPQRGNQIEAGVKSELAGGKLLLTLSAFRIKLTDVAVADPTAPQYFIAVGGQRNKGVELEAIGKPAPGLLVSAAYTYLNAKITAGDFTGNDPGSSPEHQIGVFATYELQNGPLAGFGFGGDFFYRSFIHGTPDNIARFAGYKRVGLNLFYKGLENVELRLNVRNVFNKLYFESPASGTGYGAQFGSPRSAYLSASVKF